MIGRLAIFGATGDLTARYLLPGLAALQAAGHLGDGLVLAGAGREEWDTSEFRRWAADQLGRHAGHLPASARQEVVSASRYHQADVTDLAAVAAVIAGDGPVAAYLALDLTDIGARAHTLVPMALTARLDPPELPAYGRLLLDVLDGNAALSIRGDEAEEAWRVVAPVLAAWSDDLVPLQEYPAGSDGPGPPARGETG